MISAGLLPRSMLLPGIVRPGLFRDMSLCGLLVLSGCSLFTSTQKAKLLSQTHMENTTQLQHLELAQAETALHSILVQSDTADQDFSLEIWPRGRFSFSPENGFEGEAEKIRYHGAARQSSALTLEQAAETSDVQLNDLRLEKNTQLSARKEVLQKISRPAVQWLVTIFLFLLSCAILWYYRRH